MTFNEQEFQKYYGHSSACYKMVNFRGRWFVRENRHCTCRGTRQVDEEVDETEGKSIAEVNAEWERNNELEL